MDKQQGRPILNGWQYGLTADQALGPALRKVTWPIQGKSNAPDNLFEWLLADNRYPQHRGRNAAYLFIVSQAEEIERMQLLLRKVAALEGTLRQHGLLEEVEACLQSDPSAGEQHVEQ